MEPHLDLLTEIARVLREARQPAESIEQLSLVWRELLLLIDGERQPPDVAPRPEGYRVMQEFPFVAATAEGAVRIGELLRELGFEPKRPYARYGRTVVPVYSHRHLWLGRLLELVRKVPPEPPGEEPTPEQVEAVLRVLRGAGLGGEDNDALEERARAWAKVRPLVVGWRRPLEPARRARTQAHRARWELWLEGDDLEAPGRLSRVLRSLGLSTGRAYVQGKNGRLVVPVSGDRFHWLGTLLGPPPSESSPPSARSTGQVRAAALLQPLVPLEGYDSALALQIVQDDPTFGRSVWQGHPVFAGRCPQCSSLLLVGVEGEQVSRARLARAGEGDSARTILLCLRCAQRLQPREPRRARRKSAEAPAAQASAPPEPEPGLLERETTLDEIGATLRQAGVPDDAIEEQVKLWCLLLPTVDWTRPGRGKADREIRFLAPNLLGAARIEGWLRQMGIRPSRPYEEDGQIVVPVREKRHPRLGTLVALGRLP